MWSLRRSTPSVLLRMRLRTVSDRRPSGGREGVGGWVATFSVTVTAVLHLCVYPVKFRVVEDSRDSPIAIVSASEAARVSKQPSFAPICDGALPNFSVDCALIQTDIKTDREQTKQSKCR